MDTHMRRKVMELVDNVKTKMTDQEYIEFCALLKKNEAYEPVNLEGATLVKIKFNHIEDDAVGRFGVNGIKVEQRTIISQVWNETYDDDEISGRCLLIKAVVNMAALKNWLNAIELRNSHQLYRDECYIGFGEINGRIVFIEPLEIEVLSCDEKFISKETY